MTGVMTDFGAGWLVDSANDVVVFSHLYVACGGGVNDLSKGRTSLVSQIGSRIQAVVTQPDNKTLRVYAEITFTDTHTIKEVGVFVNPTGNNLIFQDVIRNESGEQITQVVNDGDKFRFTINLAISN